jgi:hypothetical protein
VTEDPTPPGEPSAPEPDPDAEPGDEPGATPLPDPPSKDALDDIRFAVDRRSDAPLVVTLSGGPIESRYAPADLLGKVAERIGALIGDLSGGVPPMLYALVPGQSMTLILGDSLPEEPQTRIPLEVTRNAAERVAELIDLEGDDLWARAVGLGPPARRYTELTQLVQSEGFTVEWAAKGSETRELTPDRAGRQHTRLVREPEMRVHDITLSGILYRVIADPVLTTGRIGIKLFESSIEAPGPRKHAPLIDYEGENLHNAIRDGLIGEPVEAVVHVKQPRPGRSIDPNVVVLQLASIARGEGEPSELWLSIHDLLDEESA